ncbi:MAG: ATP-binding cassette domain-containing protein [Clostridia bacterium]|nr:ATP-binding cassette domain-containing protein [Clostridia bacterium]
MLLINKTLIRMSKGFRGWIIAIAVLKLVTLMGISIFASSIGSVLGNIFDLQMGWAQLKADLLRAALASVLMGVGDLLVGEAEHRCTASARIHLRQRILEKVLELDVSDVDRLGATSTINAAVDGVELMQIYYNRYLPGLIYSVLAPIYLFFALRAECMPAAVMLLVVSLAVTPINNLFKEINDKMKGDYWDTLEKLTSYYLESINGLTTTELFNRGDDREEKLGGIAQHMRDIILDVMVLNFSSTALNELLINAAIVAAVGIVCAQLVSGRIALTNALTVLMLSYSFFSSIRALQWIAHDALHGVAASQNIAKILDIDTHKPVNGDATVYDSFEGIRFDDVSFAYKGRDSVLEHVNLDIPHNGITAIAGESGCGKSTIVNMLLRFYDAKSGRIALNGRDYLSIDPSELRKRVIMVPQSVYVFSGTVRENLLIAKPDGTDAELYEALEQVRLKDWIDLQPEGLDAPVGDAGARLSGGQRQKLGIARALLSRAEYIIFDEATSSVDEENEREIWRCISELAETRTLIIISHRLSTIRNADVIYLIDDGRVTERGSHDELMAQGGKYHRSVEEQDRLEAGFGRRATA